MPDPSTRLDSVFHNLADPTRRAVRERLRSGPAAMSEMARPCKMALPSFARHLNVPESNGLVRSRKTGRVRTHRLDRRPLAAAGS